MTPSQTATSFFTAIQIGDAVIGEETMIFTTIYYYSEHNCERLGIIYDLVWLWNKYTFIYLFIYLLRKKDSTKAGLHISAFS